MGNFSNKYYHLTSYNNLYSISQYGLLPKSGFRCESINDTRYGVFLSKGIANAIIMYAYFYSFYEKNSGLNGRMKIEKNLLDINEAYKRINYYSAGSFCGKNAEECALIQNEYSKYIEQIKKEIKIIEKIMSCRNFEDYLGGPECYLSINDFSDELTKNQEDYYYDKKIFPDKINVVYLKNKATGECIDSREAILSYFMNLFPLDTLLKYVSERSESMICNLYNNIKYIYYNDNEYELQEIPIEFYIDLKQREIKIGSYNYVNQVVRPIEFINDDNSKIKKL